MEVLEGDEGVDEGDEVLSGLIDEGDEVLSGLIDEDQDGLQLSPKYKGKRIAAESKKREGKGRGRSPPPPIESPPIKSHPEEVYSMYKFGEFTKSLSSDLVNSPYLYIEYTSSG